MADASKLRTADSLTSVVGSLSLMTAEKAPRDGSCRLYGCALNDDRAAELSAGGDQGAA
jgi:hypothetical protein